MTVRATDRVFAFAALASLLMVGLAGVSGASADDESDAGSPGKLSGPTVVHIPYEGSIEVKPAAGWTFADCGAMLAATPLLTACIPDSFTASAPTYDPSQAPTRISVPLTSATVSVTVDYLIVLEPPAKPEVDDLDYGYPFGSGSRAMVPLSDLEISCGRCSIDTAEVRVGRVEPADAGSATVTGAHVVFTSRIGFVGAVEISIRVVDDIGARSTSSTLTLHFVSPGSAPLVGLHIAASVPLQDDGSMVLETDAADLVLGGDVTVIGCGPSLRGSVVCLPNGRIEYRSAAASAPDQFSIHVQREDGEQATASVTLTPAETGNSWALAPAIGETTAPLAVPTLAPAPSREETATGVTTPFVELLDRVGG